MGIFLKIKNNKIISNFYNLHLFIVQKWKQFNTKIIVFDGDVGAMSIQ